MGNLVQNAVKVKNMEDGNEIAQAKKKLGVEKGMHIPVGVTMPDTKEKVVTNFIVPFKSAEQIRKDISDEELEQAYYGANYGSLLSKTRAELIENKPSGGGRKRTVL